MNSLIKSFSAYLAAGMGIWPMYANGEEDYPLEKWQEAIKVKWSELGKEEVSELGCLDFDEGNIVVSKAPKGWQVVKQFGEYALYLAGDAERRISINCYAVDESRLPDIRDGVPPGIAMIDNHPFRKPGSRVIYSSIRMGRS